MSQRPAAVPAGVRTTAPPAAVATRLVLVRHGEAVCNVEGVVGGRRGCTGLTDGGRAQARALTRRLEATAELAGAGALYASVLPRALETAAIVAPGVGGGLAVVPDCGLCELHPGEGDGLPWAAFLERFGEPDWDRDPTTPLAPGGESWNGFVARAAAALEALARRHRGETVVAVCHAGVVEASLIRFVPAEGGRRLKLRTDHTALTEWELDEGGWRLLRYNDATHLLGDGPVA
ncbi:MAG TPA: histidine phosphatase family protein [Acidimicrobiales bacterium]|nr:histidine phosphatase family protein [Acidimicrobiales bacterium]